MSGINHNMNHIVKRVETRVLAPPGGFSSVTFGSAPPTGDVYRGHDFNPKNNKQVRFPNEGKGAGKSSANNQKRTSGETINHPTRGHNRDNSRRDVDHRDKENALQKRINRDRRDSLDELIENPRKPHSRSNNSHDRVIPGLESHNPPTSFGENSLRNNRFAVQQVLKKDDYAEVLRQQIATKKSLSDDDGFDTGNRKGLSGNGKKFCHPPYPQYEYKDTSSQQLQLHRQRHVSSTNSEQMKSSVNRRSQYGSSGHSTISLSWD